MEVIGTQFPVWSLVVEHVVDGSDDGGGDGDHSFLGAATRLKPEELGTQIAVALAACRPSGLDKSGLEPWSAFAGFLRKAFTGTFMKPWAQTGPRAKWA